MLTHTLAPLTLAFLPGPWEWIIILVIGLLLFGKRLPEVGRSLGRSIVEFKKGIKGIEDDVEEEASRPAPRRERLTERSDQSFDAPRESRQPTESAAARPSDPDRR